MRGPKPITNEQNTLTIHTRITQDEACFYVTLYYYSAMTMFVCVEVLRPNQPNGVMSSAVSLPHGTFTGKA